MDKRQFSRISKTSHLGAIEIAVLYLLLGGLWILLSDKAAAAIALNQEMLVVLSLYKGWAYVLVTALLLYWLVQRNMAALRASESQLQQLINALPVLISYVDTEERYRFTNQKYEEWFGATPRGKTVQEVVGSETYATVSKYIKKALQGEAVNYERVISFPTGERFVSATYTPDKAANGRVKGFFALVQDVTESKQAREELRRWADAFNGCAHGIAIGDPRTNRVVVCNPAFAKLHKSHVEEIVGSTILSLYDPSTHAHVRESIQKADQTGHVTYEASMVRRDGSTFPVQMDLVSVLGENGELLYRVATAQDISERRQAEKALLESSLQFRTLFEASPDANMLIDPHGDWPILDCNTVACQMNGYTHDELIGQPIDILNPNPWDSPRREEYLADIRQAGVLRYETIHRRKDGSEFPIEVSTSLISLNGCDVLLGIDRDITERKQAQEALHASEERYRAVIEHAMDAILVSDPAGEGRVLSVNPAACSMFGYSVEEFSGLRREDILDMDDPNLPVLLQKREQYGEATAELTYKRKDGRRFSGEISSTSYQDKNGKRYSISIIRDISERKLAEESMRRFELLSEHSRDIILFMGRDDGRILEVNAAALRAYGYSRTELLKLTVKELRADNTQNLTETQMAQADAGGILFETVHRRRDGTTFPAEVSSRGATIGGERMLISIIRDITERRKAQAAALEHERRYHRVLDTLMEGCQIIDFDWRYVYVNQVVAEQGRHKPEELLGRTMMEIYPGIENTELFSHLRTGMEERASSRMENRFVFPDGNIGWFELSIQPVEEGIFILSTDVTERKRAERALRESQVRLNFALEKSHTGGWDLDLVDHTAMRTVEHDRIFGYKTLLPEWTYEIFLEHVLAEDRAEVDRLFQEAINTQTNWSFECRIRRTDGEIRWIWATGGHLFDDTGQAYRMAGIVQDITERKQVEQEIRLLNERLEQRVIERTAQLESANKELEAFSYSVSHDLRAPLRAIDGYTRILVEDYEAKLDEEGKRVCGIISAEARRMGQLIDDLLSFSRLGRKSMYFSKIDMKAQAESVFNELIKGEAEARIEFQIAKLPAVNADPTLIRQVWVNLLSNAIKFTSKKEHAIIKVGSKHSTEEYVYYVRDTGAGFDMEYVEKLFGVFQRLHGESEFEGTGVGLAIVQRIIRRHGGRVWAEGEPEKGATFYFSLPRQEKPNDQ
ncbi:MAG: PAS domain S-box protein [Chloroflexota bacterium]